MKISRLFGVLVVGGALLGTGCDGGDASDPRAPDGSAQAISGDSGPGDADGAVAGSDAADGELQDCGFCPNEVCCETDDDGNSSVIDGFECCWNTTC